MNKPVVAAQLYTLRDFTKNPADFAKALKRVREIGYTAVQCSGHGPIDAKELARILKGEGLACCATHIGLDRLRDHSQEVIDDHHLWSCRYAAIGGYFPKEQLKRPMFEQFAADFNAVAKKYAGSGLTIGYHNHSHEFINVGGVTPMQILFDKLSKELWFEIDTYWVTHGGGDPCQWITKASGRIPCVHFKDMVMSQDHQQHMAEIGEGNLNWPGIIKAAKAAGTEYFIVEQDDCYGKDPFDCLATSLRNLKAMGYE